MGAHPQKPIGLRPRNIIDHLRKGEISEAIIRYQAAGNLAIPLEWIEEYNEIMERLNSAQYKPSNGIAIGHFTSESLM